MRPTDAQTSEVTTAVATEKQEFRYHAPSAGEVWLVWGINRWQHAPDANRPSGTTVKEQVLHSPLVRAGDVFTAAILAEPGTKIDFGFLITKTKDGTPVRIWQDHQGKDFHIVVDGNRIIEINATVSPRPKDVPKARMEATRTFTQEIRYHAAEAGEVWLVWGINGWQPLPDHLRPPGTTLKNNSIMNTPMTRSGSSFVIKIQVPSGSTIDFGFLITKSLGGTDLAVWDSDGAQDYHRVANRDGTIEVGSRATLFQSRRWNAKEEGHPWGYLGLIVACALSTLLMGGLIFWYRQHTRGQEERQHIASDQRSLSRAVDLTLLCVSLLAAFGIAEYGLRLLTPHGGFGAARELDWMRSDPTNLRRLFTTDSTLGFRPNLQGELYNEFGTRQNGYALEKRPGVSRLLFIGDSVTFRGQIIDALRKIYGQENYEYWNAGVESYNTVQEVKFYTRYNAGIRPDHVILTFHPNDFETTPVAFFK